LKRCLITGYGGFIGSHLAEYLLERGVAVWGLFHRRRTKGEYDRRLRALQVDILDADALSRAVAEAEPDTIFHLAAQTLVLASWRQPEETLRTNVLGTLHVLQAAEAVTTSPTVVLAGSSAEYGPRKGSPLKESDELQPASPYGYSKVAAELLGWLYWRTQGLRVLCVRPFAVIGTRKVSDVCSDLARGIVAVERGASRILAVGNLGAVRDFVDVGDAVRALALVAEKGDAGEAYNICSGTGHAIHEVLDRLRAQALVEIPVEQDPERLRPFDDPMLVGDNSKLRALGWRSTISLDQSLAEIITYWRAEADR
jgi:GDP-4-dehydro-6-deoxy-D-mannose reductase